MLQLNNWQVSIPPGEERIGFEGDHLTKTLVFECDLSEDWAVKLDMSLGDFRNIIDLEREENRLFVNLSRDMVGNGGRFLAQLRGLRGEQVAHSNCFFLFVGESVLEEGCFPPEKLSEFFQFEAKLEDLLRKIEDGLGTAERLNRGPIFGSADRINELLPGEILFITGGSLENVTVSVENVLLEGDKASRNEENGLENLLTLSGVRCLNWKKDSSGNEFLQEDLPDLWDKIRDLCRKVQENENYVFEGKTCVSWAQVQYWLIFGELVSHGMAAKQEWFWAERNVDSELLRLRQEVSEIRAMLGDVNAGLDEVLDGTKNEDGEEVET